MSQETQITTQQQPRSLKSLLSQENIRQQIALALPAHLKPERFIRIAITALTRTPKLAECTQDSFMRCLLDLSAFGLEPDGRRAHLIPFKRSWKDERGQWQSAMDVQLILDWKGLAELALRSGLIAKLHADIVCENDTFEYNLGQIVRHSVDFKKPRGPMYAAYAMAQTKDGPVFVQVLTKEEVDSVRARSKAKDSGPWVTDYEEMAKKTAFRRLSKWLPLSAEFRDAQERDDEEVIERDVSPPKAADSPLFKDVKPAHTFTLDNSSPSRHETFLAKVQALGVPWENVAKALIQNGVLSGDRDTAADCTDDEIGQVLDNWTMLESLVKGGAK